MNRIGKMREAADLLAGQKRFLESYAIYDELYKQLWEVIGSVQGSYYGYSKNTLRSTSSFYPAFRDRYIETSIDTLCVRIYSTPLSQILDEFIRIIYGRLRCICFSREANKEAAVDDILSDFAVLYTLVLQSNPHRKISPVFDVVSTILDGTRRLKKIRPNCSRTTIERMLVEGAEKNKDGEWRGVNSLLLEYLSCTYNQKTELYSKIAEALGNCANRHKQQGSNWYNNNDRNKNHSGDKQFGNRSSSGTKEFSPATATDEEKKAYYGKIINLKGTVTKAQIRSKYIDQVSLYHPDKVQHLGPELKELAERKSKEINAAYNWLKTKYHI
jgi:hypothetical protein